MEQTAPLSLPLLHPLGMSDLGMLSGESLGGLSGVAGAVHNRFTCRRMESQVPCIIDLLRELDPR